MQPTPTPRSFTQKGILQFICKIAGVLLILQTLSTLQKILSIDWTLGPWSQGSFSLATELFINATICWALLTKSDWITEKLDINADEIRMSIGKQELLELIIIVGGLVLVITSASKIFDSVVGYAYLSTQQEARMPIEEIFSGLFMLGVGLVLLKYHKRVFSFVSNLRESEHSE